MGNQYATDAGDAWELLTKLGNHIESFHSAGMGDRVASVTSVFVLANSSLFFLERTMEKQFKKHLMPMHQIA